MTYSIDNFPKIKMKKPIILQIKKPIGTAVCNQSINVHTYSKRRMQTTTNGHIYDHLWQIFRNG